MFRRSRSHVVNDTNVICYVIRPGWLIFVGGRAELSCQPPPSKLLVAVHMTEKTAATFSILFLRPFSPKIIPDWYDWYWRPLIDRWRLQFYEYLVMSVACVEFGGAVE